MVVVDEAHHARRREVGSSQGRQRPNAMLRLLQGIAPKTEGLVLLTATPMQVHPVEVWDLLSLLGLPPEWTQERFLKFFEDVEAPNPSHEALNRIAETFRAVEARYGAHREGRGRAGFRPSFARRRQGAASPEEPLFHRPATAGSTGAESRRGHRAGEHAHPAPGVAPHP